MKFHLESPGKDPIYKQLVAQVERAVREGSALPEQMLPSMNDLAAKLNISRETVKKAYGILVDKGIIFPKHGKGFFVADPSAGRDPHILVIFDKFSVYKQIIFNAFAERLGEHAELTIVNHNQSLELLSYYLDNNLDLYDYYVVAPHFPLDKESQQQALHQLSRIPNRKLIMLDRLQPGHKGHFGAVYQDFENDIYTGLLQGVSAGKVIRSLRVITLPTSLYGPLIHSGVERFAREQHIPLEFLTSVPDQIRPGDTFLVLNSQLDAGLVALTRKIQSTGFRIGQDVSIISYNESDMNELVLGGLTTVSTNFRQMGTLAADMILNHRSEIVHCPFCMNMRNTF